jgi:hypothetical protein
MIALTQVINKLREHGCDPTGNGKKRSAKCPAHDDHNPSLGICERDDGTVFLKCHAGCIENDIWLSLGYELSDLMPDNTVDVDTPRVSKAKPRGTSSGSTGFSTAEEAIAWFESKNGPTSGRWSYQNSQGEVVGVILRRDTPKGKDIRPVSLVEGGWRLKGMPYPSPLYSLPDLGVADRVFITEGEKAAEAAKTIGLCATTSAHGSQSANKTDWSPLAGKECVILPDNDAAGEHYAKDVTEILNNLTPPCVVKILDLPDLPDGGDIADWVKLHLDNTVDVDTLGTEIEKLADTRKEVVMPANNMFEISEKSESSIGDKTQGGGRARNEFCPVPSSELGDSEDVDWFWRGYIAPRTVTLIVGEWKAGKTTLICHLLKEMANGGDLAGEVRATKVLVLSEETNSLWALRRDDVGLGDHVHFQVRPFLGRPNKATWKSYIEYTASLVEKGQFDLLIIDTWASLNPCLDENDAVRTLEALLPLHRITEAGAAVLIVHHPSKKDTNGRQSARGSGALQGFMDTVMELHRTNPQLQSDRRRTLTAVGRYEETPAEVVIELTDSGYQRVGSKADSTQQDRHVVIKEILTGRDWTTDEEIRSLWTDKEVPAPGKRTLQKDLSTGCESGLWERQGKGTKGDKFKYKFDSRTLPPKGA